jgi:lycopene cyclase domain-containing protein
LEEYTFFVLQTLVMGLLVVFLAKRLPPPGQAAGDLCTPQGALMLRIASTMAVGLIWLVSTVVLLSGEQLLLARYTYLALILSWALLPIIGQFALGADILWRYRRLVLWSLVPATLYLGLADSLAITSGTWTIDPAQSTGIMLGALPLEEGVFFLLTNTLVVFGIVLVLAQESQQRAPKALISALRRLASSGIENRRLHKRLQRQLQR